VTVVKVALWEEGRGKREEGRRRAILNCWQVAQGISFFYGGRLEYANYGCICPRTHQLVERVAGSNLMSNFKGTVWLLPSIVATSVALLAGCTGGNEAAISSSPIASPAAQSSTPSQPKAFSTPAPIASSTNTVKPNLKKAGTKDAKFSDVKKASPKKVSLENDGLTFELPPGFTQMTAEEIATKFPKGGNPPKFAYGNGKRTVAIAVTFSPVQVSDEQLPKLKMVLQEQLKQAMPDAKWLKQEMTAINGKPWVHFSMVTQAVDTEIHNDMYLTSFKGKMLGFNFNSTVAEYDKAKSELGKMRDSITIR
jgi:hypothetical protein